MKEMKMHSDAINLSPKFKNHKNYLLGADIGGTNVRIALARVSKNKIELAASYLCKTNSVRDFTEELSGFLSKIQEQHRINIDAAAFCIASEQLHKDILKLTRADLSINKKEVNRILKKKAFFLNDFVGLGYSLNLPKSISMKKIKSGKEIDGETKIAIGVGTGLGTAILPYHVESKIYVPIHSEGGHPDLPLYDSTDKELALFVQKQLPGPVDYEAVLSSKGIPRIYNFLLTKMHSKHAEEIALSDDKTALIAKYRKKDPVCKETFKLVSRYYARCIKNFALEALSTGGIYIGGNVALKNPDILTNSEFKREITLTNNKRYVALLEKMPIYLITDPLAGLKGACFAAHHLSSK